jgi:lysophospholipase L1-like esterase
MMRPFVSLLLVLAAQAPGLADDPLVIASMDEMRFTPPKEKGTAELVEGKSGKAIRFRFEEGARSAFFSNNIRGTAEWDKAVGFSFWVKGEGVDGFGGLEFIFDDDYAVRYDYCFPVKGTNWTRVVVAWGDLIPVLPGPKAKPLGPLGTIDGNLPSKLTGPWVGKWWYWGDYPPIAFAIDDIRLVEQAGRRGPLRHIEPPPLSRVLEKLRAGKPITVVTMGDSLTDKRHWANRETCWVDLLKSQAKAKYGSDVTIVNPAIGGTQLRQNLVLLPRWLDQAPAPDLVTVFFGGNDFDAGMRGGEFRFACDEAVSRIRRATFGQSDILILTTNPSASRWEANAEMADACRVAAREYNAGLADTEAAFQQAGKKDREKLFVDDRVHLSRLGHEVVAETVLKAIEASK